MMQQQAQAQEAREMLNSLSISESLIKLIKIGSVCQTESDAAEWVKVMMHGLADG